MKKQNQKGDPNDPTIIPTTPHVFFAEKAELERERKERFRSNLFGYLLGTIAFVFVVLFTASALKHWVMGDDDIVLNSATEPKTEESGIAR
jgi:hypothetical protein